ncbi:hypothetical protein V1521DRAFT_406933, partial [Lipomyces starkeyi]
MGELEPSKVCRAEVRALMITLGDMACGVPLACASALDFLESTWRLKGPVTDRGWPLIRNSINIPGGTLSLARHPTAGGLPKLLSAIYLERYFGPEFAANHTLRVLVAAAGSHARNVDLGLVLKRVVLEQYVPAAVGRLREIVTFTIGEEGYMPWVVHMGKDQPLDDETRTFLMQTRAAQAHPATVFSAHERIFGSSNDLLPADAPWHPWAPWADSRHLLINGVGMRILADTLPAVLAHSGVRVLPSFSSLAPTRFWVLGQ